MVERSALGLQALFSICNAVFLDCGKLEGMHESIAALAAAVAYCLPDGWDHVPDPELSGAIHGPDGMCLILSSSAFAGREVKAILPVEISIAALAPRLRSRCRIRVALAHDPDALAVAIESRLLPVYVPLFRRLAERATLDATDISSAPDGSELTSRHGDLHVEPVAGELFRATAIVTRDQISALRAVLARVPS